jgi:hypothetical protein
MMNHRAMGVRSLRTRTVRFGLTVLAIIGLFGFAPVSLGSADSSFDIAELGGRSRSLEAAFGIDFEEARARAADLPGYDYEVDQEDLDNWVAAQLANPALFDGLTIRVILAEASPAEASQATSRVAATRSSEELTEEDKLTIMRLGGAAAAELDQTMSAETAAPVAVPAAPAPCTQGLASLTPTPSNHLGYLLCDGEGPFAMPIGLTFDKGLSEAAQIAAALDAIATVSPGQQAAGLYSLLKRSMVGSIKVDGDVASVDFTRDLATAALGSEGLGLVEQVVNTVFSVSGATQLVLTLDGSCQAFVMAVGGDTCHTYLDSELTNTERIQNK